MKKDECVQTECRECNAHLECIIEEYKEKLCSNCGLNLCKQEIIITEAPEGITVTCNSYSKRNRDDCKTMLQM